MILALGVLVLATLITVIMLVRDVYGLFSDVADWSMAIYRIGVDVWLICILPVTLYPFLGGKVWCRYWCPLAKLMDLMSKLYVKLNISRYHIESNDKCISCNECSRNCLVGIDVMSFARHETGRARQQQQLLHRLWGMRHRLSDGRALIRSQAETTHCRRGRLNRGAVSCCQPTFSSLTTASP